MMELTVEQFEQFDKRLQVVEQGQRSLGQGQKDLEREIAGVKQDLSREIVASQVKIIQWVVGLFFGSTVTIATIAGVYISVLLAR